ncbi:hypothetical protein PGT21_014327 [Puccinia graminis f. sp. tritici]|uniref:Uncharacterized protein n=1 Tax=Puccinia graminis f. sp. tritici TaxID=56615 RepID=A0A5B0PU74_PUCGR|nr:hypothetical protein PGT21_014327 [Puccinia graminis f. sp. tritici]
MHHRLIITIFIANYWLEVKSRPWLKRYLPIPSLHGSTKKCHLSTQEEFKIPVNEETEIPICLEVQGLVNDVPGDKEISAHPELIKLVKESQILSSLPKKQREILFENWEKNYEKVISVDEEVNKILKLQKMVQIHFEGNKRFKYNSEGKIKSVREYFESSKIKLQVLKEVRLLELANLYGSSNRRLIALLFTKNHDNAEIKVPQCIQNLPGDMVIQISHKIWTGMFQSLLEGIKQIIFEHGSESNPLNKDIRSTFSPDLAWSTGTQDRFLSPFQP